MKWLGRLGGRILRFSRTSFPISADDLGILKLPLEIRL
jgi:hypothetical protein